MTRDELEAKQLAADLALELGKEMKRTEEWQRIAEMRLQGMIDADRRLADIRNTLQKDHPAAWEAVHQFIMVEDHG